MDENRITKFLKALVDTLKENNTFCFIDSYENLMYGNIENFIWIGTHNRIGITDCHYEVIFHTTKTGFESYPSVEVHFEGMHFKNFQEIELPVNLEYQSWTCNSECCKFTRKRRIVYCNGNTINIQNTKNAIKQVLEILTTIHKQIGQNLEQILYTISKKENLLFSNTIANYGKIFFGSNLPEIRYLPERYYSSKLIEIEHTKIQKLLIEKLQERYASNKQIELPGIYVEALLQDGKKADLIISQKLGIVLYEVKTYDNPIHCIREALGQLLEYKWRLEKMGYSISEMIIIGPEKETKDSIDFINKTCEFMFHNKKCVLKYICIYDL